MFARTKRVVRYDAGMPARPMAEGSWGRARADTKAALHFWGFWLIEVTLVPVVGAIAGIFLPESTSDDVRALVGAAAAAGTALALIGAVFLVSLIIAPCRERDESWKPTLANLGIGDVSDLSAREILTVVLERLAALEGRLEKLEPQEGPITGEAALVLPSLTVRASGVVTPRIIDFDLGGEVQAAVGLSDGLLEDLIVRVDRSWEEPATVRLMVNGNPSNFEVSITGTGIVEDLTGTASVARGDEIRCELVVGGHVRASERFTVP